MSINLEGFSCNILSLKKVSIFLKDKVQNWNGGFVLPNGGNIPHGFQAPGNIT